MEEQTKSVLAQKKSDCVFSGKYGEMKRMMKGLQESQGVYVEPRWHGQTDPVKGSSLLWTVEWV